MTLTADALTLLLANLSRTGEAVSARLPAADSPAFSSYCNADVLAPFRDALAAVSKACAAGGLKLTPAQLAGDGDIEVTLLDEHIAHAKAEGRHEDAAEMTRLGGEILALVHIERMLESFRSIPLKGENKRRAEAFAEDRVRCVRDVRTELPALEREIKRVASVELVQPFALQALLAAVNELLKAGNDYAFVIAPGRTVPSKMLADAHARLTAALRRFRPEP